MTNLDNVIQLPVDISPLPFMGRDDENEGQPISASVLRDDIVNDDLENFSAGYPTSSPEEIDFVWSTLASQVMNESVRIGGASTKSAGVGGYERVGQGDAYKSMHNIAPLTEEGEDDYRPSEVINKPGGV